MLRNQISLQGFTSLCIPFLQLIPLFTQAGSFSSVHWMLASYPISDRVLLILLFHQSSHHSLTHTKSMLKLSLTWVAIMPPTWTS